MYTLSCMAFFTELEYCIICQIFKPRSYFNIKLHCKERFTCKTTAKLDQEEPLLSTHNHLMSQKTEGISFNKVIPVRRTSEQSVLSSLSLKSNLTSKTLRTSIKCRNHANSMGSSQVSLRPHQQKTSATSLQNSNIGVKMPFTSGGDTLGGPNNGSNSQDIADDAYETDDNDTEDENHKSSDLTQQALRKLSFLKINNDNSPSFVSNSDSSRQLEPATPTPEVSGESLVQLPVSKQPPPITTTLASSRSNSTSVSGGIKQVSSFLNTTMGATTTNSSSSSSSSISSTETFKNRKQTVQLRQLQLQQQQQAQQQQHLLIQGKNGLSRPINGQRSIMKPSSSSSILFSKSNTSAQTPPPPSFSAQPQQGVPISATSHLSSNQTRNIPTQFIKQINNPKRPMYTPAVLRNVSETNLTNDDYINIPQSISQSLSSSMSSSSSPYISSKNINNNNIKNDSINNMSRSMDLPLSNYSRQQIPIPIRSMTPMTHLHLNSTKCIRTSHWVPDSMRDNCKKCHIQFSLWERKHHCRHCGEIFCHRNLQRKLFLNSDAQFTDQKYLGKKFLSKVCDLCYNQFQQFITDSQNENDTLKQSSQPRQLIINQQNQEYANAPNRNRKRKDSIAGSVPVDWNWSSF